MSHKRPHPSPRQPYPKQHGNKPRPSPRRQQHFPQAVWDETERLFSKKFSFQKPEDDSWHLPPAGVLFSCRNLVSHEMAGMKEELNRVKGLLSDKEIRSWHEHTNQTNRAGKVISHLKQNIRPQLCTQAWCKFHEIVCTFPLVSDAAVEAGVFSSVHLCEAPGAFITSLNHYLVNRRVDCGWNWVGNSLNPYYEGNDLEHTIDDDRFIFGTLPNWHFGADNTGDIMSAENLQHLKTFVEEIQPIHLVTADGSIDCQKNPGEQESIVSQLHYCEVVSALQLLGEGGALVVKKFTMLEPSSACLMYLLNCVFDEVHAFKPATSKSGNSEVYVVCLGYSGQEALTGHMDKLMANFKPDSPENDLFPSETLPATFTSQLVSCCRQFTQLQCDTIQENLQLFEDLSEERAEHLRQARDCCAQEYVHRYHLRPIRKDHRIYTEAAARSNFASDLRKQLQGSFNERQQQSQIPWAQRVLQDGGGGHWEGESYSTALASVEEPEPSPSAVEDLVYPVVGRRVRRVWNSRFCDVHVLSQWNEALDKAQILLQENTVFLRKFQEDTESSGDDAFLALNRQQLSQSLLPKILCLTNTRVLKRLKPYLSAGLEPKIFSVDSDPVETFLALKEVNSGEDILTTSPEDRTGVLQDSR
ncbi:PREDICTED: cap-specific mRNA (nucleoside-2'-O-)-methyltransferase 2-like [Branchiostoma belcheri]|uniref:Cap-specific mRNA (nucleoside-2'-O-)-methyltransferase 2 n=1 Tax=Branchiostoma belcheri TaxID=7741 RepID=A0A6P4Y5K4_BRABE|nr:PREDICTED: cap-specific mRNA (nucleoside-2'-O-)-methyltransferase 2-like [Branchiostoma belcheri]